MWIVWHNCTIVTNVHCYQLRQTFPYEVPFISSRVFKRFVLESEPHWVVYIWFLAMLTSFGSQHPLKDNYISAQLRTWAHQNFKIIPRSMMTVKRLSLDMILPSFPTYWHISSKHVFSILYRHYMKSS